MLCACKAPLGSRHGTCCWAAKAPSRTHCCRLMAAGGSTRPFRSSCNTSSCVCCRRLPTSPRPTPARPCWPPAAPGRQPLRLQEPAARGSCCAAAIQSQRRRRSSSSSSRSKRRRLQPQPPDPLLLCWDGGPAGRQPLCGPWQPRVAGGHCLRACSGRLWHGRQPSSGRHRTSTLLSPRCRAKAMHLWHSELRQGCRSRPCNPNSPYYPSRRQHRQHQQQWRRPLQLQGNNTRHATRTRRACQALSRQRLPPPPQRRKAFPQT